MIRLEHQPKWMREIDSELAVPVSRKHMTSVGRGSRHLGKAAGIPQNR